MKLNNSVEMFRLDLLRSWEILSNYRKIPKINPSMYKPLQIQVPQTHNAKNPPLNRPPEYKPPPGACTWKLASNTKQNKAKTVNFLPTIRLARSILKRKFPSVDEPLQK